jgi:energy-coupling factor transport system ATP-binding protein
MPAENRPALQVQDMWFGYDRQAPVLKGIDLAIPAGDFVALTGPNGSGKTTLAKHFNGLLRPDRGQVALFGQDLRQSSTGEIARTVGYVFQNPDHQIFSATTRQEIAFGLHNLGLDEAEIRRRTAEALETFRLSPYAGRQPATLSYGLRRKISLASVLAMRPQVLILDEPTTGLDWQSTTELVALLEDYHAQGNTILLITHDMRLIADHLPRCLVLAAGQVLDYGETRQVLKDPQVAQGAQLIFPQVTQLAARLAPLGFRPDTLTVGEFCEQYRELLGEDAGP